MSEDFLNNIPESAKNRLNDDELEALEIIQEAFALLNDNQRAVMSMYSSADTTIRDIAKKLGLPLGTVLADFDRAKNKIREYCIQNADRSIYIESMLREITDDEAKTNESADSDADKSSGPAR
jgi:DNA-directed RNA polymerase specialized sigma24 family protein